MSLLPVFEKAILGVKQFAQLATKVVFFSIALCMGIWGAVNTWLQGTSALELAQNGVVFTLSSQYVTVYIASSVRRYSAANIKKSQWIVPEL